jgi:hypothetical protein
VRNEIGRRAFLAVYDMQIAREEDEAFVKIVQTLIQNDEEGGRGSRA